MASGGARVVSHLLPKLRHTKIKWSIHYESPASDNRPVKVRKGQWPSSFHLHLDTYFMFVWDQFNYWHIQCNHISKPIFRLIRYLRRSASQVQMICICHCHLHAQNKKIVADKFSLWGRCTLNFKSNELLLFSTTYLHPLYLFLWKKKLKYNYNEIKSRLCNLVAL